MDWAKQTIYDDDTVSIVMFTAPDINAEAKGKMADKVLRQQFNLFDFESVHEKYAMAAVLTLRETLGNSSVVFALH